MLKTKLLTYICAALEYLVDRGEIEMITKVETKCRYKGIKPIDHFIVVTNTGERFKITAEKLPRTWPKHQSANITGL